MKFNVSNCKRIHYGRNNPGQMYTMNNLEKVEDGQEKDLGIIHKKLLIVLKLT